MAKSKSPKPVASDRTSPSSGTVTSFVGRRFQRGDSAATRTVQRRVQKIVAFRGYGMSREDRRDVEQEVMSQLWQAARRGRMVFGAGFWGFVEVVTARRCIDWLRRRRQHVPLDSAVADQVNPLSQALTMERVQLASAAIERLDEPCRRLIRLRLGEGRSFREISGDLGKSEGALRVQMYRCVQKAGEILKRLQRAEVSPRRQAGREE